MVQNKASSTGGRGKGGSLNAVQAQNFLIVFGTKQGNQVALDTKMIKNLLDQIKLKQDD